jgi:integrase
VESLLSTVDRSSPVGKRDYAILLLAARLGMRSGDIRNLRLENLDWENATMEFVQEKTRAPQRLPLSEEVGTALIDYLRHGRPVTSNGEVFLGLIPPFSPFKDVGSLHRIITMYRRRAGIGIPASLKGGMHALRHSLATRLLEAGTPLETISNVMGHVSPESTLAYVKASAETLRTVALDWEATHE